MGSRLRFIATLVSFLALIGQLMLPVAHAASMARQHGDPLLVAFCGEASSQNSLKQFRETAPPELLAWLRKASYSKAAKPACDLCASVHDNHLAGTPSVSLSLVRSVDTSDQLLPAVGNGPVDLVILPPLRAPPGLI